MINFFTLLQLVPCLAEDFQTDSLNMVEYQFSMQARGNELTGICIVSEMEKGVSVGTIVNEFGVKALDFSIEKGKVRVFNVIKPLDRWYIRKVLRKDFSFIFQHIKSGKDLIIKKRKLSFQSNGDMIMDNERYKIRYTFSVRK